MSPRDPDSAGRPVRRPWFGPAKPDPIDLEAWYRRYGDMVFGRCRSLLRNDADAEEMTQEVFVRAWRARDTFRADSQPSTFLFRIATTTCLNLLRTRRRHPEDFADELPVQASLQRAGASPEEQAGVREMLDHFLDLTDEGTVQVLVYHHLDGLTYEEIAQILDLSVSGVRKRLSTFRGRVEQARPSAFGGTFAEEEP